MPNDLQLSRRSLSRVAFGTFISSATFRPGRQTLAQDVIPVGSGSCPETSLAENEAIVQRFWDEVWNQQNDDALSAIFDANGVHHWSVGDDTAGPDEFLNRVAVFRSAFPDFQIHVDYVLRERDRVVTRWIATGTHAGAWYGVPATGRRVEYTGNHIFRIACGKIAESWEEANHLSLLQQIGGLPSAITSPSEG